MKTKLFWTGIFCLVICGVGLFFNTPAVLRAYLIGWTFWFGLSLGCLGILLLYQLTGGAWGDAIGPMLRGGARMFPLLGILFLPCVIGMRFLFPWAAPGADVAMRHHFYFAPAFFVGRTVFYFLVWSAMAKRAARENWRYSAPALVALVITATFASTDWTMSLEPRWTSTIYGMMLLTGHGLAAFAAGILVVSFWRTTDAPVRVNQLHDLGKLLFAFIILWAYMAFSQYLITWSGNLQEEIPWYLHRTRGGWQWVAGVVIAFQFALPFALLLSREVKRRREWLAAIAALILLMRYVDLFWLLNPAFYPETFHFDVWNVAAPAAVGGFWLCHFFRTLAEDRRHG